MFWKYSQRRWLNVGYTKSINLNFITLVFLSYMFPFLFIWTCIYLYPKNLPFINFVNDLLTTRIKLGSMGLTNFGASFIGQNVEYVNGFTFDNIYSMLLVEYGIVWLIVISVLLYALAKRNNIRTNIFIIIWCFYAMSEVHGTNPFMFFPLLLLVYLFDEVVIIDFKKIFNSLLKLCEEKKDISIYEIMMTIYRRFIKCR